MIACSCRISKIKKNKMYRIDLNDLTNMYLYPAPPVATDDHAYLVLRNRKCEKDPDGYRFFLIKNH